MNEQVKQHTVKVLEFLKNHQHIDNLTLTQIQERIVEHEDLLIEFVEKLLEDKEDENGTLTTWWLFENVDKKIYSGLVEIADLNKPEDFINYMIERNDRQ